MSDQDERQEIIKAAKALGQSITSPPTPKEKKGDTPSASVEKKRFDHMPQPELMDKAQLVKSILELQEKLPLQKGSRPLKPTMLGREKKEKLQEILGTMMDRAMTIANSPDETPKPTDPKIEIKQQTDANGKVVTTVKEVVTSLPNRDAVVERLFIGHTFLAGFVEKVSENEYVKATTHTDLKGLRDDFVTNKEELKRVIGRVYDQHGAAITPYLTPLNDYIAAMSFTILGRAAQNIKKEDFPGGSKKKDSLLVDSQQL